MRHIHTAVTIKESSEIEAFYVDLLGMERIAEYKVDKDLSKAVFDLERESDVVLVKKDDLLIEIFISPEKVINACNHLCFGEDNRKKLADRAYGLGYRVFRKEREEKPELIFIYDRSGNIFEIKD